MEGRRSTDLNYVFGYPRELPPNILPTESDVVSHSLFLKRERIASKEWKQNTPLGEIATKVTEDICELWSKTGIPHFGTSNRGREWVIKKTEKLLTRSRDILKVPKERRNNVELLEQWGPSLTFLRVPTDSRNSVAVHSTVHPTLKTATVCLKSEFLKPGRAFCGIRGRLELAA